MKHIDIFEQGYSIDHRTRHFNIEGFRSRLDSRVLVWTANHEHAVFDLWDDLHPATVCVWFQYKRSDKNIICKIVKKGDKWIRAERESVGNIPFVNNNPFTPTKQNAASNTAASVFPANQ